MVIDSVSMDSGDNNQWKETLPVMFIIIISSSLIFSLLLSLPEDVD